MRTVKDDLEPVLPVEQRDIEKLVASVAATLDITDELVVTEQFGIPAVGQIAPECGAVKAGGAVKRPVSDIATAPDSGLRTQRRRVCRNIADGKMRGFQWPEQSPIGIGLIAAQTQAFGNAAFVGRQPRIERGSGNLSAGVNLVARVETAAGALVAADPR